MSEIVVSNSSCLIALSRIDKLELLHELFGKIYIPSAVFHEVITLGRNKPGLRLIQKADWIDVREVKNRLAVMSLLLNLGSGESEAIILAKEIQSDLIILDDLKSRRAAISMSLKICGTLALIKKAKEKNIIPDIEIVFEELKHSGFYINVKI